MAQRAIDLVLSVLATAIAFGLSWPFWRTFGYWAESHSMWWTYFGVGFVLAVYVFYVFMRSIHTLFRHDALTRTAPSPKNDGSVQ